MELVTIDDLKSVSIGSIINECCSCEDMYYILWGEIEASKDPVAKKVFLLFLYLTGFSLNGTDAKKPLKGNLSFTTGELTTINDLGVNQVAIIQEYAQEIVNLELKARVFDFLFLSHAKFKASNMREAICAYIGTFRNLIEEPNSHKHHAVGRLERALSLASRSGCPFGKAV